MAKIAIMGFGTVGSGVLEVCRRNAASIARRAGEPVEVKYILDVRDFSDSPDAALFVKDINVILNDLEVKVVVETIGGTRFAYPYVRQCLESGRSVCTSNKEMVATYGAELLALAREHKAAFLFEASVGGGIPIIRPISQCLAANEVLEIAGILNGTTNFILTKMIRDSMSFEDALALAQQLGYAERNPAADIEGHDACRKICILASLAFGRHVYPEQVHTEGITNITLGDVEYADAWGGVIKLIGSVKRTPEGKVQILVAPMMIPRESQLANVDDVFNGILVRGDETGDVVFYGKGAGKLPTASAVVADIIDCVKHVKARKYLYWEDGSPDYVEDYRKNETLMYVRVKTADPDDLLEKADALFDGVSRLSRFDAPDDELAFYTEKLLPEGVIEEKLQQLKTMGGDVQSAVRIADL